MSKPACERGEHDGEEHSTARRHSPEFRRDPAHPASPWTMLTSPEGRISVDTARARAGGASVDMRETVSVLCHNTERAAARAGPP